MHETVFASRLFGFHVFERHDPDPHAVDGGKVMGLAISVVDRSSGARHARLEKPFYVFFVKAWAEEGREQ